MKKYLTNYGILRIAACLLVILHHCINYNSAFSSNETETAFVLVIDNLCMVCNGLFFMMSGRFALAEENSGFGEYYLKKLKAIYLPMLFVQTLGYLLFSKLLFGEPSVHDYFTRLLHSDLGAWYWFMYVLLGCYLSAPIISRLIKSLSTTRKKYLLLLLILFTCANSFRECLQPYLYHPEIPFMGYMVYFLLGYLWEQVGFSERQEIAALVCGLIASVISCCEMLLWPGANPSIFGLCPTRVLMCLGIYLLLTKGLQRLNGRDRIVRPVQMAASLTYFMYLWHGYYLEWLQGLLPVIARPGAAIVRIVEMFLLVLLLSAGTALLMKTVLNKLTLFYKSNREKIAKVASRGFAKGKGV
ncbi:MAG: acyltransferase [Lachnospiraceae bacterium]|nr:acyltransferase [Lachnospiraceae bacterium]